MTVIESATSIPVPASDASGRHKVLVGIARALITFGFVTALLLVLWIGFLNYFEVSPYVGKMPGEVRGWVFDPVLGAERRTELWDATRHTLVEAGTGFITGIGIAVFVAVIFTLSRPVERAILPIALALRSVPIVAMVPLLAFVLGRGALGSLVIISIITFFPALVLVSNGLRSVRVESLELVQVFNGGAGAQLLKVRLPSALPSVLASAKVCAPLAVLGSILNGWLSTGTGLGAVMVNSTITAEYVKLWAAVVVVTVVSILFAAVVSMVEQVVLARYAPGRLEA